MSATKSLKGGGPQGSTKGVLSYMSQSNNNTDCVPEEDRFKYFDDATVLEVINLLNIGLCSYRVKETIPSNIPEHNQIIHSEKLKSQKYLKLINQWTEENLMELNERKTKAMLFNFSKNYQFSTDLMLKGKRIEVVEQTKLLGLILTSDLKWEENTNYLVKDANRRMVMLRTAAKFTSDKYVLKQIYFSRIRCKLEQSAAVWSSSLTLKNINDLERVQKSAVRIINGKPYESYSATLKDLGILRLSERRDMICLKFAKNSLRMENFKKLFPRQSNSHEMKTRQKDIYQVSRSFGKRFEISAIPSMQRLLNKEYKKQRNALKCILSPTNYACRSYC